MTLRLVTGMKSFPRLLIDRAPEEIVHPAAIEMPSDECQLKTSVITETLHDVSRIPIHKQAFEITSVTFQTGAGW
jgi:hypothetical protein